MGFLAGYIEFGNKENLNVCSFSERILKSYLKVCERNMGHPIWDGVLLFIPYLWISLIHFWISIAQFWIS